MRAGLAILFFGVAALTANAATAQPRLLTEYAELFTDADSATVRTFVLQAAAETAYVLDDPDAVASVAVSEFRVPGFDRVGTRVRVQRRRKMSDRPSGTSLLTVLSSVSERIEQDERFESMLGPRWIDHETDREACRSDPRTLLDPAYKRPAMGGSRPVDFQDDRQPELIGGLAALQRQVVYPEPERRAGIEGRVWVQFVVSPRGEVQCVVAVASPTDAFAEAGMRAVKGTRFVPGAQRGRTVTVRYSLPINFVLN